MCSPCKKIKYMRGRRRDVPIIKVKEKKSVSTSLEDENEDFKPFFYYGEGEFGSDVPPVRTPVQKTPLEIFREWVEKKRFIPQNLSDDFLSVFLSGCDYNIKLAESKLLKYFYSRQEPSPLFRQRDPLSEENANALNKVYVLPMPNTTLFGDKVIIMGAINEMTVYNPLEHIKILGMVIDLLLWENNIGIGNLIIIFDGRYFQCPQLLERKKIHDHRSITRQILETIPGSLKGYYFLYPPSYVSNVADSRDGLWIRVVKCTNEMAYYVPPDMLPLEYGGNLGPLQDFLREWRDHLDQNRHFFTHFEHRMSNDYRRRKCHEKELKEGGKNWVSKMKIVADEWEYKTQYYERMKNMKPYKHPRFGKSRMIVNHHQKEEDTDPFLRCRRLFRELKEKEKIFEPTFLYHGYAPEIRKAKKEEEIERMKKLIHCCLCHPLLEIELYNSCP